MLLILLGASLARLHSWHDGIFIEEFVAATSTLVPAPVKASWVKDCSFLAFSACLFALALFRWPFALALFLKITGEIGENKITGKNVEK